MSAATYAKQHEVNNRDSLKRSETFLPELHAQCICGTGNMCSISSTMSHTCLPKCPERSLDCLYGPPDRLDNMNSIKGQPWECLVSPEAHFRVIMHMALHTSFSDSLSSPEDREKTINNSPEFHSWDSLFRRPHQWNHTLKWDLLAFNFL